MQNIKQIFIACLLLLYSFSTTAENIKSLVLFYDEVEEGVGAQKARYIINDQYMRIDDGDNEADYILFDVNKKFIYSINHEDKTILNIKNRQWSLPEFDFNVSIQQSIVKDAPRVFDKPVHVYSVKVGQKTCTKVFLIKDAYPEEMKVLHKYQLVLSGQQISTLANTPQELHNPCFLVDQVYHTGDYYKSGLPIQISYSRNYAKFLKDFKKMEIDKKLFMLPQGYQEYGAFIE